MSSKKDHYISAKSSDVIVFDLQEENIYVESDRNSYVEENILITLDGWMMYPPPLFRYYFFVQNADTMKIKCGRNQEKNYYFKNLVFKSGCYTLMLNFDTKKSILGNQIETSEHIQNILFQESFVQHEFGLDECKDIYFKDMVFVYVDINDTTAVKLDTISEELFWED